MLGTTVNDVFYSLENMKFIIFFCKFRGLVNEAVYLL